jgi:hypothetical protein
MPKGAQPGMLSRFNRLRTDLKPTSNVNGSRAVIVCVIPEYRRNYRSTARISVQGNAFAAQ